MEKSASGQIQQEVNSSIQNENENTEIQEASRTSRGNENQNEESSVIDIVTMLKMYKFFVWNECRICRVPYHLRKWNKEAYAPNVISIGPYHHGKKEFQTMEKHKVRYFNHFIQQAEIKSEELVKSISEMENSIRSCYVETVWLKSEDFVRMIMLDASFILELFLRCYEERFEIDDPMFMGAWLLTTVFNELLLENQVPFFVIEELYHLALPSRSNSLSLIRLTFNFYKSLNIHEKDHSNVKIQHFTDLLGLFQLPDKIELPERHKDVIFPKYSATQLREAGVKFKVFSSKSVQFPQQKTKSKSVRDLNFKKGVLEIPLLDFQDSIESRVQNIMVLEQCDPRKSLYYTDFFLILDCLVNTAKDVELLSDKEIVVNSLDNNNVVTSIINKINRGIMRSDMNKDYRHICKAFEKCTKITLALV